MSNPEQDTEHLERQAATAGTGAGGRRHFHDAHGRRGPERRAVPRAECQSALAGTANAEESVRATLVANDVCKFPKRCFRREHGKVLSTCHRTLQL